MNILNEPVHHRQFGSGKITEQTLTRITVEFSEEHGVKKFSYPDVFKTFLELSNPVMQQKLQDELQEINEQEELVRRQHAEDEERRQEAGRLILREQKREASKKKASSKKSMIASKEKGKD